MSASRRILLAAAAVGAAWLLLAIAVFGLRPSDDPGRADAVLVLAGSKHRLPLASELVRRGAAPVLVVSRDPTGRDRAADRVCERHETASGEPVFCFVSRPYNTRGEARSLAAMAREQGWESVVVVTSRFHLFRSELLLERCFDGDVRLVPARVDWWRWPEALVGETAKLGHALLVARSC